jgi:hypothetical protein
LWKNFICLLMHDVIDQQSWPCAFFLERLWVINSVYLIDGCVEVNWLSFSPSESFIVWFCWGIGRLHLSY